MPSRRATYPAALKTGLKAPPGQQVYVLLVEYKGDCSDPSYSGRLSSWLRCATGGEGRVVTFPDCYAPILVPKRKLRSLKKQLGDEMLPLSPGLELDGNIPVGVREK